MASPLILMFDGLHHGLYQLFLATKYLLSMAAILCRYRRGKEREREREEKERERERENVKQDF